MMNNKQKVMGALKGIKNKVIDKTSDVLSAPSRAISDSKSRTSTALYERMKNVNDTPRSVNDGGPNKGKPSQLYKNRFEMRNRKDDQIKALKKRI
jgi:hypothetical protein